MEYMFSKCVLCNFAYLWCLSTLTATSQSEVIKSTGSTIKENLSLNLVKMGVACDRNGTEKNGYGILIGYPEENRPLERSKLTWEHNIKLDLKENERLWSGFICPNRIT